MASPNTIVLKSVLGLSSRPDENRAGGAVTPGDLVLTNAAGASIRHNVAGGYAEAVFAKEDYFQGKTINDDYASGDLVQLHRAQKGDEIYAFVAAAAVAIVLTDFLTSDGAGGLKKAATTDIRVAAPIEALDNSLVGTRARLRIRVL